MQADGPRRASKLGTARVRRAVLAAVACVGVAASCLLLLDDARTPLAVQTVAEHVKIGMTIREAEVALGQRSGVIHKATTRDAEGCYDLLLSRRFTLGKLLTGQYVRFHTKSDGTIAAAELRIFGAGLHGTQEAIHLADG